MMLLKWLSGGKYLDSADSWLQKAEPMSGVITITLIVISRTCPTWQGIPSFWTCFVSFRRTNIFWDRINTVPDVFNNIIEYMYEQYRDKIKDKENEDHVNFDYLKVSLGKTAYQGIWGQGNKKGNKTVFSADEFTNDTIFRLGSEIGFLTSNPENDSYRKKLPHRKVYRTEFFHKFIQEYFASCYLVHKLENSPNEKAYKMLDKLKKRNDFVRAGLSMFFCASSFRIHTTENKQFAEVTLKNLNLLYVYKFVYKGDWGELPNSFSSLYDGTKDDVYQNCMLITPRWDQQAKDENTFVFV